jgi:hypothetical protein
MEKSSHLNKKNLHLIFSALAVIIIGLTYGLAPNMILPIFFDFNVETTDLNNVFRAIMGLYLALGAYWIVGILNPNHWRPAALMSVIFMGGLAFGRVISILFDGIPSLPFSIGTILEILFVLWGIRNLKSYEN